VVECLCSKSEALSSNPVTDRERERERERKKERERESERTSQPRAVICLMYQNSVAGNWFRISMSGNVLQLPGEGGSYCCWGPSWVVIWKNPNHPLQLALLSF
jgi:hypothetical protein